MASFAEDGESLPDLNVGSPEAPYYDPEMIAEQAVWPLVDYLWRGDWRKEAFAGQSFIFPKVGIDHKGRQLSIKVMVDQAWFDEYEEFEEELHSTVAVVVDEILPEPQRSYIVDGIVENDSEKFAGHDIGKLVVKQGTAYTFETDGEFGIDLYQEIEEPSEGMLVWHVENNAQKQESGELVAVDMEQGVRFREHDLETLDGAFRLLGAPQDLVGELDWIRLEEAIEP